MYKYLLMLCVLVANLVVFAQNSNVGKEEFTILDKEGNITTNIYNGKFLMRSKQLVDSTYRYDTYFLYGPLLAQEAFKNIEGTIKHGLFCYYSANGGLDSTGCYNNNNKEGNWYYYTANNNLVKINSYNNNILEATKMYAPAGKIFDTNNGYQKTRDELATKGTYIGWRNYIQKEVRYPDRAATAKVKGEVSILFTLNDAGKVNNAIVMKSLEISLDDEALRLINNYLDWLIIYPTKTGANKGYKLQTITFDYGEEGSY